MTGPSGPCLLAPVRFDRADWPAAVKVDVHPHRPLSKTAPAVADRRQQILNFITDHINARGFSPSLREIGAAVGLKSVASVARHVWHLQLSGRLVQAAEPKRARTLRPTVPGGVA